MEMQMKSKSTGLEKDAKTVLKAASLGGVKSKLTLKEATIFAQCFREVMGKSDSPNAHLGIRKKP